MEWMSVDIPGVFDRSQHPRLVRELLQDLPQTDFRSQLAARRIRRVSVLAGFVNFKEFGKIKVRNRKGCFDVVLNQSDPLEEQLFTLGHEIGHTYLFFPVRVHDTCAFARKTFFCGDEAAEEDFCEEFARQWVVLCDNQRELRDVMKAVFLKNSPRKRWLAIISKITLEDIDSTGLQDFTPQEFIPRTLSPEEEAELPF